MSIKSELQALIVKDPNIQLKPGEICLFYAKGNYGIPSTQTTTNVKPGLGIGIFVPLTKRFGITLGKRKVKTETTSKTVWNKEPCEFYILGERIAVKMRGTTADIELESITDLKVNKDALTISCGQYDHYLFMSERDVKRFINLFGLIGQAQKSGIKLEDLSR